MFWQCQDAKATSWINVNNNKSAPSLFVLTSLMLFWIKNSILSTTRL
jgi:hypothetical protein